MIDEYDCFTNEYINLKIISNTDLKSEDGIPLHESLFRAFWGSLKRSAGDGSIRIYITGVSPVSLVDHTSGFNIHVNMSFEKSFSGFCGLTSEEMSAALETVSEKNTSMTTDDITDYLNTAKRYYNGYHFCCTVRDSKVFNTSTCLGYLQVSVKYIIVFFYC